MLITPSDIDIFARTVWGEGRGEPLFGKIAIAWAIRNRVDHPGWWGSGITGVCQAPFQFSCWNKNDPNRAKLLAVLGDDAAFRDCLAVVAGVLAGLFPDTTSGANHYHTDAVTPQWAEGRTPSAKIGAHVFFKL